MRKPHKLKVSVKYKPGREPARFAPGQLWVRIITTTQAAAFLFTIFNDRKIDSVTIEKAKPGEPV
jgi:hypothetical protein